MGLPERGRFDPEKHEAFVSERLKQLTQQRENYAYFDKLVDMALDGCIEMDEALTEYRNEIVEQSRND